MFLTRIFTRTGSAPICRRAVELLFPMFSLRASAVRCASAQYWGMVFLAITEKDYLVRSKCQADGQSYNIMYIYIYYNIHILCVYASYIYYSRDGYHLTHPQMNLLSFVNWIFLQISQ
jgi:hypothetical protein